MATEVFFGNRRIKLPGAYSTIVSGEQSQPIALDFGKVLVIDTGVDGATWGGGSGIAGEQAQNADAIYRFNDLDSYQFFLKGGQMWKNAEALFKPDKTTGALGVSEVIHVRAAATTKAQLSFTATGGGANGGTFVVNTKDEGLNANGTLTSTHLDKGYAYKIETGTVDVNKWVFKIFLGNWKGDYSDDGIAYDEIAKSETTEILMAASPEFDNIQTLIDWANQDSGFGQYFSLDASSAVAGDGSVDSADVAAVSGFQVATGGTETYSLANLSLALDALVEENFSFILCDQYGTTNYKSSEMSAITSWVLNDSLWKRFTYVGGGKDSTQFSTTDGSLDMGAHFNSSYVHVVHSDVGLASSSVSSGFRRWNTSYHAALYVGRTAGKQPQVPITYKSLGVDKVYHEPTKAEKERALDAGVKMTYWNKNLKKFVNLQDVNTLQDNKRLFTPQGKSHQGSFMRIIEQINSELVINAEIDLLADENGVNVNTLGSGTVKNFTETYLESRLATASIDNYLLDYRDVTVTRLEDTWKVTYGIVVNNEINKILFTGFLFS